MTVYERDPDRSHRLGYRRLRSGQDFGGERQSGRNPSVRAFAAHGVLSGPAVERIEKSELEAVYFTDSIQYRAESSKIKYITVAEAFGEAIKRVYKNQSISSLYYK